MADKLFLMLPVGRLLQGSAFEPRTKNYQGQPLKDRNGMPTSQYYIGVGIPKGPEWEACWAQIYQRAQQDFPNGEYAQPYFKWKIEDGDGPKYAGKPDYAGHMLVRMQSQYQAQVIDAAPIPQPITVPDMLKRGYYVRVQVGIAGNSNFGDANAGLFMNPSVVQMIGYGPVIESRPELDAAFSQPVILPAGASATPLAPTAPLPVQPGVAPTIPGVPPTVPVAVPGQPVAVPLVAPVAVAPVVPIAVPGAPAAPLALPVAVAPAIVPGAPVVPVAVPLVPPAAVAPAALPVAVAPAVAPPMAIPGMVPVPAAAPPVAGAPVVVYGTPSAPLATPPPAAVVAPAPPFLAPPVQ